MLHALIYRKRIVAFIAVLALLGCSETIPKKISLQTFSATHMVSYYDNRVKLPPTELAQLHDFLATLPVAAISYVEITGNNDNARDAKRLKTLQSYLTSQGVARETIHFANSVHQDRPERQIRILITFTRAIPPEPCPNWSANATADYNNADYSNFGCAYTNNLAVQLQNPADLQSGHGKPAINGARDSVILQNYNNNTPPVSASAVSASAPGASAR